MHTLIAPEYLAGLFNILRSFPSIALPALPPSESDLDIDPNSESYDCIDEILSLFRANVLFRNFEIKGPADRMLIYGILFLSECLGKVKPTMTARDAEKVCYDLPR